MLTQGLLSPHTQCGPLNTIPCLECVITLVSTGKSVEAAVKLVGDQIPRLRGEWQW